MELGGEDWEVGLGGVIWEMGLGSGFGKWGWEV